MSRVTNHLQQTAVKQSFGRPETFLGINRYLTNGRRENCQCTGVKEEVMGNKGPEGVREIKGQVLNTLTSHRHPNGRALNLLYQMLSTDSSSHPIQHTPTTEKNPSAWSSGYDVELVLSETGVRIPDSSAVVRSPVLIASSGARVIVVRNPR